MTAGIAAMQLTALEGRIAAMERLLSVADRLTAIQDALGKTDLRQTAFSVIDAACDEFSRTIRVSRSDVLSRRRQCHVSTVRQVAMFVLYRDIGLTSTEVGELFSRDHGTVLHAEKAIQDRADVEPEFRAKLQSFRHKLETLRKQVRGE